MIHAYLIFGSIFGFFVRMHFFLFYRKIYGLRKMSQNIHHTKLFDLSIQDMHTHVRFCVCVSNEHKNQISSSSIDYVRWYI